MKPAKKAFLFELQKRFGDVRTLPKSQSLFDLAGGRVRIYIRYSKRHGGSRTFYGLRQQDLQQLEGRRSFICFLWDGQSEPLIVPFYKYEDLLQTLSPAVDGQYKVQVLLNVDSTELYFAAGGRFSVDSHYGWEGLGRVIESTDVETTEFTHSQMQTLLGAIGVAKGYDIWIPRNDRGKLGFGDISLSLSNAVPSAYEQIRNVVEQVDVVWFSKGNAHIRALYEVEHSTSIYSGLLRFNDIHLVAPSLHQRFAIVAQDVRRARFSRQLHRPTFKASGLHELCSFVEYPEVFGWYKRQRQ